MSEREEANTDLQRIHKNPRHCARLHEYEAVSLCAIGWYEHLNTSRHVLIPYAGKTSRPRRALDIRVGERQALVEKLLLTGIIAVSEGEFDIRSLPYIHWCRKSWDYPYSCYGDHLPRSLVESSVRFPLGFTASYSH